jgi:hypothetical protein
MKLLIATAVLSAATILPSSSLAQQAVASRGNASTGVVSSESKAVPAKAVLSDYLSSKSTKVGEPVAAKLTNDIRLNDGTILSRGTVLLGHVSQVDASKHGSNATLTLTFDQAKTKTGAVLPGKATIYRVAQAFDTANIPFSVELDGQAPVPASPDVEIKPLNRGSVGLRSSRTAQDSGTLISNGQNLTLTGGTQMLLSIASQPGAATQTVAGSN